eukprot:TRINITY_DN819_c0_g1_i4.p2 TRINITY_DN819_c0_g1~~TRINITY_DN819_c0_g1_i4.p2  ORF type:complete len:945 (-),score=358.53 TRINITY_DN819_c0_g1_i4:53-2887(-)
MTEKLRKRDQNQAILNWRNLRRKKAGDVLKQVDLMKKEANIIDDAYDDSAKDTGEEEAKPINVSHGVGNEEIEEKVKRKFEERLLMLGDLSEFERNKLRDELSTELINLEYVLAGEREQQEISIRRMLQGRRKKGKDVHGSVENIDMKALKPEEKIIKEKIEQEIDDEKRDRVREVEQKALQKIQKSKDRLLKQLGAPSNLSDKEKDIILNNHRTELEQLLEGIKQEKDKQIEDLEARIEKRKQSRVKEQIQKFREEMEPEGIVEESNVSTIEIPKEIIESQNVAKLQEEEKEKETEMEKKHKEQQTKLLEAHKEEISVKENEFSEDLEIEVETEMEARKAKVEEKFKFKQQEVEEQRRKLKDQLLFSSSDKEASQALLEEVKSKDGQLKEILEQSKKEQDLLLEEKINRRRIAKQKKLLAFKNAQHDMSIELKLKQLKEKHELQGKYETEKIKEIVNHLREVEKPSEELNARLYTTFDQLWNEKEGKELANMFGRQLAEKESKLRAAYNKSIEQKLMEKQGVKEKYRTLYEDLEERKEQIGAEAYEARSKELRVEEENDLKEMDIKESMSQKKEEYALRQDLEEKSANEITDLQEKLADQKVGVMKELFGNLREEEVALRNRIREMKETIDREKDRKIKDIELDKKIILEKYENEMKERYNTYEDILKKQRETEKLIKEKKGNIDKMIEERKRQIAELKGKAQITPEQEKQLLEKYQLEVKNLENAMEAERIRQFASMKEKLESKQSKREREKSYQKKKVAFMMGTVGKNVTLAQGITEKVMSISKLPKNELERMIFQWKRDMEDREKSQKTTTFETLQRYIENVGKFKEKGQMGIFLQGMQYHKYLQLIKAAKILHKKLEELHRIKASGALLDLKAALKIFAEDDFDRLKARPERIGGGFRCFDEDGNILWDLFKFIHSKQPHYSQPHTCLLYTSPSPRDRG